MSHWAAARALATSERAAQSIFRGREIFAFVTNKGPLLLRAAKEDGQTPPVAALGPLLHAKFGECVQNTQVRQWLGALVKAILAFEYYKIDRSGVRIVGDPVFGTGSTYRFVGRESGSPENLMVERNLRIYVRGLTEVEQRILCRVLEEEVP